MATSITQAPKPLLETLAEGPKAMLFGEGLLKRLT
jgi:hypothetical protein